MFVETLSLLKILFKKYILQNLWTLVRYSYIWVKNFKSHSEGNAATPGLSGTSQYWNNIDLGTFEFPSTIGLVLVMFLLTNFITHLSQGTLTSSDTLKGCFCFPDQTTNASPIQNIWENENTDSFSTCGKFTFLDFIAST
jgi:hypothetical protein